MTYVQCLDELIVILKHKIDKYINFSVIRYDIKHMAVPEEMAAYLIFTFETGFLLSSFRVKVKIRIANNIVFIFENNMIDEYTDTILRQAIHDFMKELKTFIFYRK